MRERPLAYDLDHNPLNLREIDRDDPRRVIGKDQVGKWLVSTVFLYIDHNFGDDGPPILYETMVFDGRAQNWVDHYMQRYATRAEAQAGHADVVGMVRATEIEP